MPWSISYEEYVGLQMNRPRMRLRRVYFQGLAQSLADGTGEVPLEVIRAACDTDGEAHELAFEINAARHRAQAGW